MLLPAKRKVSQHLGETFTVFACLFLGSLFSLLFQEHALVNLLLLLLTMLSVMTLVVPCPSVFTRRC